MNYELAKKLKDAGFLQLTKGRFVEAPLHDGINVFLKQEDVFIYAPTLEELIEACGKDFFNVTFTGETYSASGMRIGVSGKTPSEAVANLWLKLNKK